MNYKTAFTLAEILITLGIIGVVSAITIPTLISTHQREVNISRAKKLYSIFSQNINQTTIENGELQYWNWDLNLQQFVETYLLKNLNITKNCKTSNGCWNSNGIIYGLNGTYEEQIKTSSFYKIQLADGTYIAFRKQDNKHLHIYCDVNGNKRPDKYGIDNFVLTITPGAFNDSFHNIKVAGVYFYGHGLPRNTLLNGAGHGCNKTKSGAYCGALFQYDNWQLQSDYKF